MGSVNQYLKVQGIRCTNRRKGTLISSAIYYFPQKLDLLIHKYFLYI